MGDSTTEGLQDPDGHGGYRGWANRFAEHLARAQGAIHYANLGVRGLQAAEVRDGQLGRALSMKPDIATVVAGVNDVIRPRCDVDEVADVVRDMVEALRSSGTEVLTFTMPDMTRVMPAARLFRGRLERLNERLRQTCRDTGARLLDVAQHHVGGDPRLWHEDRLHANALGHERIGMGLAHLAGLEGHTDWCAPLPAAPSPGLVERARAELSWSRTHLMPWLIRRWQRASSSDGRTAKRPELAPFEQSR